MICSPRSSEEEMRALVFVCGVLVAAPVSMAEPLVFHTTHFPDTTSVQLSMLSSSSARAKDYDFDVLIGLVRTDAAGVIAFEDLGRHHARVRCGDPAYVGVGLRRYPIPSSSGDWKESLWKALCAVPMS
jgi:hypothetical protein